MELWQEMVRQMALNGEITFQLSGEVVQILESKCYSALNQIRDLIRDEALTDEVCFQKIEAIVCAMEELGSNGGCRHDFG